MSAQAPDGGVLDVGILDDPLDRDVVGGHLVEAVPGQVGPPGSPTSTSAPAWLARSRKGSIRLAMSRS